jgi:AcrR family transcriptional regulator
MVRKKVYKKEHILQAAIEIVEKDGFNKFTARNIAKHMNISTQPIYLEFKNMDDLKETVLVHIFNHLFKDVFPNEITGDPLVDIALNFVNYSNENPRIFRALYVEESGLGYKIYDRSFTEFRELVKRSPKYQEVDEVHIEALHIRTWIVATGLAVLTSSGIFKPTQEQMSQMLSDLIKAILANPNPVYIE